MAMRRTSATFVGCQRRIGRFFVLVGDRRAALERGQHRNQVIATTSEISIANVTVSA